jgi:hypothetical protein
VKKKKKSSPPLRTSDGNWARSIVEKTLTYKQIAFHGFVS